MNKKIIERLEGETQADFELRVDVLLADLANKVAALEKQAGINRGGKHGNN